METIFFRVIELSFRGIFTITIICLLRLIFKKSRRTFFCVLWEVCFLKLVLPLSIPLSFGAVQDYNSVHYNAALLAWTARNKTLSAVDGIDGISVSMITVLWIAGILFMTAYQVVFALRLKKSIKITDCWEKNVFLCENMKGAFAVGLFRPRILIAENMDRQGLEMVLLHEKCHILRCDNLKKVVAWIILSVHWFNPFAWAAYRLFCADIELACDETVVAALDKDSRKRYACTVLEQSVGNTRTASISAFGSAKTKCRIEHILQHQRITMKQSALFCVIALIVFATAFADFGVAKTAACAYASQWAEHHFGKNYDVRNLESQVLRECRAAEREKVVVRIYCQTSPKFQSMKDTSLAKEAKFGEWEELTMDVMAEADQSEDASWKISPVYMG